MTSKKGVSDVIATVLLIMLTVAAASILYFFIIPMIKNMLENSQTCHEMRGQAEIETGEYTCAGVDTRVKVRIGEEGKQNVSGLLITLDSSGTSRSYEIRNNTESQGVLMLKNGLSLLELPRRGGAETYLFSRITAESARVAIIAGNGNICAAAEEKIEAC